MDEFEKKFEQASNWINGFKETVDKFLETNRVFGKLEEYNNIIGKIPETESEIKFKLKSNIYAPLNTFVESLGLEPKVESLGLEYSQISMSTGATQSLVEINHYSPVDDDWYTAFKNETYATVNEI